MVFQKVREKLAEEFSAVGAVSRLDIIYLLMQEGELTVGNIAQKLRMNKTTVSQHLAKLRARNVGLVVSRREGQRVYYRVTKHPLYNYLRQRFAEGQQ